MAQFGDVWKIAKTRSLLPTQRAIVLYNVAYKAAIGPAGDMAEFGVYRGGSAYLVASVSRGRPVHLYDTFTGIPASDPAKDAHRAGDFHDADLDGVEAFLRPFLNVRLHVGVFPGSADGELDRWFGFAHVDVDVYASARSACEFFWPRLIPGGVMLFDDYGPPSGPGIEDAVEEFCGRLGSGYERDIIGAYDEDKQCVLRRPL